MNLTLRGLGKNKIATFAYRLRAIKLLLDKTERGIVEPRSWTASDWCRPPAVVWSPQQAEVIKLVQKELDLADANVSAQSRTLFVSGGPGTGKTETMRLCATEAAERGQRVLIACPIGALVDTYRQRLPANDLITVETVHSSFKITRNNDAQYVPPGRLRHYDLIVFDESSQLEGDVWFCVRTACAELMPGPFILFVADFQQLQSINGKPRLKQDIDEQVAASRLKHIELQQYAAACCSDPALLDFLNHARVHQPSKEAASFPQVAATLANVSAANAAL